jgi:excisionase family DNA binding protein
MVSNSEVIKIAYSIREAVEATSLSRTTIYKLINEGDLPIVKVGGRSLIPSSALIELLAAPQS